LNQVDDDDLKDDVTECSLANNVISKYTSFIGVEVKDNKITGDMELENVPLEAPARSVASAGSSVRSMAWGMPKSMGVAECCMMSTRSIPKSSAAACSMEECDDDEEDMGYCFLDDISLPTGPQTSKDKQVVPKSTPAPTPVATINKDALVFITSGSLLISLTEESLAILLSNDALKVGDVVEITGLGLYKILVLGSSTEKWIFKSLA